MSIEAMKQAHPVADRDAFERHWKKVRGEKKSDRELKRHPLQPQTYIQDSANRHWVTWQAATRKAAPPTRQPLTSAEIRKWWASENGFEDCDMAKLDDFEQVVRAVEAKHGITG